MTTHAAGEGPFIINASGTEEPFDVRKLEASLAHAGAGTHTAHRIAEVVANAVFPGTRTADIYRRAFALLRQEERRAAAHYGLRRALLELGPTGHPFEDYLARVFAKDGWTMERRKLVQGKCIQHEVDLYATRGKDTMAAELKYHNDQAYKTDVKVALYVKARFEDIWQCDPTRQVCPVGRGLLITNTKFTQQAIAYAACAGLELIGWNYPEQGSLEQIIIASKEYPITVLVSLKKTDKRLLLEQGIVSCTQLPAERTALREIGLSPEEIGEVLAESATLCAS